MSSMPVKWNIMQPHQFGTTSVSVVEGKSDFFQFWLFSEQSNHKCIILLHGNRYAVCLQKWVNWMGNYLPYSYSLRLNSRIFRKCMFWVKNHQNHYFFHKNENFEILNSGPTASHIGPSVYQIWIESVQLSLRSISGKW